MAFFSNFLAFLYLASRTSCDFPMAASLSFSLFLCLRNILSLVLPNAIKRRLLCRLNLGNGNDFLTKPPPLYLQQICRRQKLKFNLSLMIV